MNRSLKVVAISGLAAISMMLGVACDKQEKPKAQDDAAKSVEAKSDDAAKTGVEGDASACDEYATKFCEAVGGEQNPSCVSMTSLKLLLPPAACQAGLKDLEYTKTQVAEMGKKCTELMDKLCADLGPETKTCGMVKQMTPSFPPERCVTMLGQYDKVLAELKAEEEKNKPLSAEMQAKIAAKDAPSFGPADSAVTIVEFSDFQCPYCTMAATAVNQVKEKYGDKVHFVYRQFPLSFHQDAHLAHQAGLAANEQGKFWEMHDKMFENQKALKRADLEKYAKEIGLDMKKFNTALDKGAYKTAVDGDIALGQQVYVQGTPTMFINGERVSNPTDFNVIEAEIKKVLEK